MREIFAGICPPDAIVAPGALRRRDPGYSDTSRDAGLLLRAGAIVPVVCLPA